MYCKDCKYWDRAYNPGECNGVTWVYKKEKINDNAAGYYADASDDNGLDAGFRTGPLFGCVTFVKYDGKQ